MYGLLAHEIGHHLQGHTLLPGGSKPPTELEADSYAGFVLAKLGATESEAISLWETLPEKGSSTHPGRAERVATVRQGWARGRGQRPTPPVVPAQQPASVFVIADSHLRALSPKDVAGMPPAMLRLARNEIFARHGYTFDSEDLRTYFGGRSWYIPRGKAVTLNAVEKANVDFIRAQESANGGEVVERGIIFPQSSAQYLSREEVLKLSPAQRRIARNEIFARRGYIFNDPQLSAHFSKLAWYKPQFRAVELNPIEESNVRLIRSLE